MVVILIFALFATNLVTGIFLMRAWQANQLSELQFCTMAIYAGALQSRIDFEAGKLRLYELAPEGRGEFTNRYDGPFEVWRWPYQPALGHAHKYSEEQFVRIYNEKMRFMHDHPNQFERVRATTRPNH